MQGLLASTSVLEKEAAIPMFLEISLLYFQKLSRKNIKGEEMKQWMGFLAAVLITAPMQQALAATTVVEVKALENSTGGGSGASVSVIAGNSFSVSVDPLDLWSAGALPRWSNADGLAGPLFATGFPDTNGDDPGVPVGTLIGGDFGLLNLGGLSAPHGTLVGQWGSGGNYFAIGTSYTSIALENTLNLFYFDSNNGDNSGSILATVTAVPSLRLT